eukprot:COSAG02_NODE_859_length_16438_cov_11.496236_5_plen_144_part_00
MSRRRPTSVVVWWQRGGGRGPSELAASTRNISTPLETTSAAVATGQTRRRPDSETPPALTLPLVSLPPLLAVESGPLGTSPSAPSPPATQVAHRRREQSSQQRRPSGVRSNGGVRQLRSSGSAAAATDRASEDHSNAIRQCPG